MQSDTQQIKPKYSLLRKDYNNIRIWYQQILKNCNPNINIFNPINKSQKLYYYRLKINQLHFNQSFVNKNLLNITNTLPNGLNIVGSLFSQETGCYIGKTYQKKGRNCLFNPNEYSLKIKDILIFGFYVIKWGEKKLIIEFQLVDNNGKIFRIGTMQFQLGTSQAATANEIIIQSSNSQQIGKAHVQVDLNPIKFLQKLIPPQTIISNQSQIPPLQKLQLQKKKNQLIISSPIQLLIKSIEIQIENYQKLLAQINKNNPFGNYHQDNLLYKINNIIYKVGYHNTWMIVYQDGKEYQSGQFISQGKQNTFFGKNTPIKRIYYDSDGQLLLLISASITYGLKDSQLKITKQYNLGWIPIIITLSQQQIKYKNYLVTNINLPNFNIQFETIIKSTIIIINPQYKKYRKKYIEQKDKQFNQYQSIINNTSYDINSRKSTIGRKITSTYNSVNQQVVDFQIQKYLQILAKHLKNNYYIIPNGKNYFIQKNDSIYLPDNYPINQLLEKNITITLKIKSILPHTSHNFRNYQIPTHLKGQLYILRHHIKFQFKIQQQNAPTFGIPIYLKVQKQHIIKINISNKIQLSKILRSRVCVILFNAYNMHFYGIGSTSIAGFLSKQGGNTPLDLQLTNNIINGSLIIDHKLTLTHLKNNKQITEINPKNLIKLLPMKQRLQLRINNYNKSKNTTINNIAISTYKQINHIRHVNQIISKQYNNSAQINYQIGISQYLFIDFINQNPSENNIFKITIDQKYGQIVTNSQQYLKICQLYNKNSKQGKITYIRNQYNHQYQIKILDHQKISFLIKYTCMQWQSKLPSIMYVNLKRNTLPVHNYKIKLNFKQPIIDKIYYYQQLLPKYDHSYIQIIMPIEIQQITKNIIVFYQFAKYDKKSGIISIKVLENSNNLDILLGLYSDQQFNNLKGYGLIKINLLKGSFIKVNLGQILPYQIPAFQGKLISIIKLQSSDKDIVLPQQQLSVLAPWYSSKVLIRCLSPTTTPKFVTITMIDIQSKAIVSNYLLKIICVLKDTPIPILIENYSGFKQSVDIFNKYNISCQFILISSSFCIEIIQKKVKIKQNKSQKINIIVIQKIIQNVYLIAYNQNEIVSCIYEIVIVNSNQ